MGDADHVVEVAVGRHLERPRAVELLAAGWLSGSDGGRRSRRGQQREAAADGHAAQQVATRNAVVKR